MSFEIDLDTVVEDCVCVPSEERRTEMGDVLFRFDSEGASAGTETVHDVWKNSTYVVELQRGPLDDIDHCSTVTGNKEHGTFLLCTSTPQTIDACSAQIHYTREILVKLRFFIRFPADWLKKPNHPPIM